MKPLTHKRGDKIGECFFIKENRPKIDGGGTIRRMASFVCRCGNEFSAKFSHVKYGVTKSCGCIKNKDKKNNYTIGKQINGLLFKGDVGVINKKRKGLFQCPLCGTDFRATISSVACGTTKSCGCSHTLSCKERAIHNMYNTPTYKSWVRMKSRCYNKRNTRYYCYGGKGISVCERWHDFLNFYEDMGERPSQSYSIDRIDINKNYEPGNCRWATRIEQARNKSNNIVIFYNGVSKNLSAWVDELGLNYSKTICRIRRGWDVEKSFTYNL